VELPEVTSPTSPTSPEMTSPTSPEAALTGTESHRSDRVRMRSRFPRFFLTIVVVQNEPLRMTNRATGSDQKKGVRIRNRMLCNVHPSGAF
jgi:hypothetical protein